MYAKNMETLPRYDCRSRCWRRCQRLAYLTVAFASIGLANSCVTVASSTPLNSASSASYSSCGGTTPQSGDNLTVASPLQITANLALGAGVLAINGANAVLTWDGNSHTVSWTGSAVITVGCYDSTTSGCSASPYSIDTCTTPPASAGQVMTWTVASLTSADPIFKYNGTGSAPSYSIRGRVCDSIFNPGSGQVLIHTAAFGLVDMSDWTFRRDKVNGGAVSFTLNRLSSFTADKVSVNANSDTVFAFAGTQTQDSVSCAGTISTTTVTCTNIFGAAVGSYVTGTGLQNATRITSVAPIGVSTQGSFTINKSLTATIAAATLTFISGCDIADFSWTATTSTHVAIGTRSLAIPPPPCLVTNAFVRTDPTGATAPGMMDLGAGISNSLLAGYYTLASTGGCGRGIYLSDGSGFAGILANLTSASTHNAFSGLCQNLIAGTGMSSDTSFFAQTGAQSITGQGSIFGFGSGCPFSSSYDVVVNDNDPGTEGIFTLNNTSGVTASSPCPVIKNATVVMGAASPGGLDVGFGEDDGMGGLFSDVNSSIYNSIVVNGFLGITCRDTTTTFLSGGTGGVGVYNNDVYNATTAYAKTGTCSHFDNGVTAHPSATYGDTTFNPLFSGTVQYPANPDTRWNACDLSLGGSGSIGAMATMFFARWTGAVPTYTTSQVVDCLRAPFTPTAAAALTAGAGNVYIGALQPSVSSAGTVITGGAALGGALGVR